MWTPSSQDVLALLGHFVPSHQHCTLQTRTLCLHPNGICINLKDANLFSVGFIEFIVSPSFQLCGDMLKLVVPPVRGASQADQSHDVSHDPAQAVEAQISRWERCLSENKSKWEQKSQTPRGTLSSEGVEQENKVSVVSVETRVVGSDITSARRKNHVLEKQQVVSESDDHTPSHTTLHDNDTGHVNTPD